jgi:hypothetical protein
LNETEISSVEEEADAFIEEGSSNVLFVGAGVGLGLLIATILIGICCYKTESTDSIGICCYKNKKKAGQKDQKCSLSPKKKASTIKKETQKLSNQKYKSDDNESLQPYISV